MTQPQQPLFPQPIPIIGVTGEYASGKTLFGLSICPQQTLVYDTEKSCESYQSLGFTRVDVASEMLRRNPSGYKPVDTFLWWRDHVKAIAPGKYRVIMLDTASEIESGLADWVRTNPQHFGKSAVMYQKMSGVMWGDVKEYWKMLLSDLSSRCETFVFTVHMGTIWAGDKPTGKRKPKGKETLTELASLYLQMERRPDTKGAVPEKPSAVVLKSRLAHLTIDSVTGDVLTKPILPPRLPVATVAEIRRYCNSPADYAKLKKGELAPEETLSDDERLQLRAQAASDEAEAARLQLEVVAQRKPWSTTAKAEPAEKSADETDHAKPHPSHQWGPLTEAGQGRCVRCGGYRHLSSGFAPCPQSEPTANGNGHAPTPAPHFRRNLVTENTIATLISRRARLLDLGIIEEDAKAEWWQGVLEPFHVRTARDLDELSAQKLSTWLRDQIEIAETAQRMRQPAEPTEPRQTLEEALEAQKGAE